MHTDQADDIPCDGGFRPPKTLYVTRLNTNTSEADLREVFSRFGHIRRIYVAKNRAPPHRSRGFAFVSFWSCDDAARAMDSLRGEHWQIQWAKSKKVRNLERVVADAGTEDGRALEAGI